MTGMMSGMTAAFMPLDPDNPCPQWQAMAKESARMLNPADAEGNWTCRRVGPETVNGRSTVKFEGVTPKGEHHFGWIDPKLRFLVKSEGANGTGMELQNIKEGPQQASLFEVPAGFQKLDMGKGMQQLMQQGGKPPG